MSKSRKKLTDAQIQSYLDDQLSLTATEAVEEGLRHDAAARHQLEDARLLRHALRKSAPEVPSDRMWKNIHAQLHKQDAKAFPKRLGSPAAWWTLPVLRWGLAAACVAVVVVGLNIKPGGLGDAPTRATHGAGEESAMNSRSAPPVRSARPSQPAEVASARTEEERRETLADHLREPSQPRPSQPVRLTEAKRSASDSQPAGSTAVERALQRGDLDAVIRAMLEHQQTVAKTPVSMAAAPQPRSGGQARTVAMQKSAPSMAGQAAPAAAMQTDSRIDRDGFWNWGPAALAMNRRDWNRAKAEFDLARREAGEASERSFGASARLSVNKVQGAEDDLGLGDLRRYPGLGLVVLSSGAWQLFVPNRQARFQNGVETRLNGYRSKGPGFIYELSFDRGEFAPGTEFTRMAGELAATVVDADGNVVEDNHFRAPRGAEFNFSTGELRLK